MPPGRSDEVRDYQFADHILALGKQLDLTQEKLGELSTSAPIDTCLGSRAFTLERSLTCVRGGTATPRFGMLGRVYQYGRHRLDWTGEDGLVHDHHRA